ncbi:MAG: FAD-dependent oxidoreductase, partial [Candidatus Sumerlaeota bacterium]
MRQFLFDKVEESGMSLLLNAFVTGVEKEGDAIRHLEAHAKEGLLRLEADVYIDATGDGDVAAAACEEFSLGRESDGKFQPMTLIFSLEGVDTENCEALYDRDKRREYAPKLMEYVERGEVPSPAGHLILIQGYRRGSVKINMTNVIDLDGTKSEDLTEAEVVCRKQLAGIVKFLRNEVPGFENCYVASSADMMGVRSTRHFKGRHVINEKEISEGTVFDDWVVSTAKYIWGTHNLFGAIHGDGFAKSKESPYGPLPCDNVYTIPFRSLRPSATDNLLLAGRCISGTFLAHSNYRVMPICMAMGQGAGTAAAMASEQKCKLDDLDIKTLQDKLMEQGVDKPK